MVAERPRPGQGSTRPPTPYERVRRKAQIPEALKDALPSRWERLGDVLCLRFPEVLRPHQEAVCDAYAQVIGAEAVVDHSEGVAGAWRQPRAECLWGGPTETVHTENGIRYRLDPCRVMWSPGNVDERIRMGRVVTAGEVVVDMFAGIGYFALPMALHGRTRRVYACEANPVAYRYLEENVRLNGADAVRPLEGDCRDVAPEGVADRVLLGYLDDTHRFLPKALRALRGAGWVHYHEACPDAASGRLVRHLEDAATSHGSEVQESRLRRVKSYAPGVSHWVVDALIAPAGTPPSRSP